MTTIIMMLAGILSGVVSGRLSFYLLETDTNKIEDAIIYFLFSIPVSIALLHVIQNMIK